MKTGGGKKKTMYYFMIRTIVDGKVKETVYNSLYHKQDGRVVRKTWEKRANALTAAQSKVIECTRLKKVECRYFLFTTREPL